MAKKSDDLNAGELLSKYESDDDAIENVDDNPIEEVPTTEIMVDIVTQDKDHWRFMALGLVFANIMLGYFIYDLSEQRAKDPVVVYNQATGNTTVAQAGNYKAEGFLSSVSRGVMLYNTWDNDTFSNVMSLVSDIVDGNLILAAKANEKKKRAIWEIDNYGQKFKVKSASWPILSDGTLQKWMPGYDTFTVVITGDFTISRKGKSKTFPLILEAGCQIITPDVKHPHGFKIVSMRKAQ